MWWKDRAKRLRTRRPISEKTIIFTESVVLSLLCLSLFLFRTEPGQAAMAHAGKAAAALGLEKMLPQKQENATPVSYTHLITAMALCIFAARPGSTAS